jgi:acyl transferase domain-containing protein/acyl carrier protein
MNTPEHEPVIRRLLLEKYEPIAVVGIGLRFPGGSTSPEQFADFLREGRSGIRHVPEGRWDIPAFTAAPDDDDTAGKIRCCLGGYLDQIDQFDAQFFNISPKEAQYTDPQQRMLLETTWQALEHANIDPAPLRRGLGGVYVGASSIDYALELDSLPYEMLDGHLAAGITFFPLSGRISYFLGWRGPCLTVDAACASSLTALHQAVTGLRRGECDIALAAGVNALHHPRVPVIFSHANMLAPDGQCKTFDESADGYVRAEGCAVLVLKRLSDAQRDGDTVHALVRGTAVGQDGDSAGLSVPNGTAQTAVMGLALAAAALRPADIQYVEAHGTGTPLGDPIEMGAINDVFEHSHTKDAPLLVGSVKTNLGHMEPVAGLVGIIKTILQMRENTIYPHLNCTNPSSRIPWGSYPVEVPTTGRPWTAPTKRALVNSFGFGGTIAVAVIEQPPPAQAAPGRSEGNDSEAESVAILTVSAKNKRALRAQIERYQEYLEQHPEMPADELCHATNTARSHFNLRVCGVVKDRAEVSTLLARRLAAVDQITSAQPPKVAFLFTGQGSQYPGMAAHVYQRFPVVREHVDECDRLFTPMLGRSISAMLLDSGAVAAGPGQFSTANGDIDQTQYTQPALFVLEYALAQLWLSWGIRPAALIGHSIGEVAAAAVAGLFSLPDAVKLVATRGRLMQSVSTPGGMVAVSESAELIRPLLTGHPTLAIAALNSPGQCVISGADAELARLMPILAERGIRAKRLPVSHAFHSPLMTEVLDDFRAVLREIRFGEPTMTLISNLTGSVARPAKIADAEYWVRHICEPVNFEAGMHALERRGRHLFLEVGPSTALGSLAKQCVNAADHLWATSVTAADTGCGTIMRALSQMYLAGLPIDWCAVHRGRRPTAVTLPTYAFDRKRYWLPQPAEHGGQGRHGGLGAASGPARHPLLGEEVTGVPRQAAGVREFRTRISAGQPEYLADRRVSGHPAFPGLGYLEILLALQDTLFGHTGYPVRDVRIGEPLFLHEETLTEVLTRARPGPDGTTHVEIVSRGPEESPVDGAAGPIAERCHVTAVIDTSAGSADSSSALCAKAQEAGEPDWSLDAGVLYDELAELGREYGPQFRRLDKVGLYGTDLSIGELRGQDTALGEFLPPAIADATIHQLTAMLDGNFVPVRCGWFRLYRKPKSGSLRSVLRVDAADPGEDLRAGLILLDGDNPVFELRDLGLRRAPDSSLRGFFHRQRWLKEPLTAQAQPAQAQPAQAQPGPAEHRVLILGRIASELGPLATLAPTSGTELLFAQDAGHAGRLLRENAITDVFWFWRDTRDPVDVAALRAGCEANYRNLLALVGELGEAGFGRDQRLWLLTERGQWLPGDLPGSGEDLAAATVWGFGHVLLNEYPAYRARMVDLDGQDERTARLLLSELAARDSAEYQIAFREGLRYVHRLLPCDPEQTGEDADADMAGQGPQPSAAVRVRPDRTYVICGGLGGFGLVTAHKLVDLGARHLALLSRGGEAVAEARQLYERLVQRADVSVLRADLSDPHDMAAAIARLEVLPHPVGGIVHAAGGLADAPIAAQSWESIDRLFQAKVYGTWLLDRAVGRFPQLDFVIAHSSASSIVGGAGQSNYAAANAYLDAVIQRMIRHGGLAFSFNWGALAQVGMSARLSEQYIKALEREGVRYFSPARAMRALAHALDGPPAQLVGGECDWDRFCAAKPVTNALYRELTSGSAAPRSGIDLAWLRDQTTAGRIDAIEGFVRAKAAAVLHLDGADEVDPNLEFVEFGLDSLMALELKNILEATLHIPLPSSLAFDYPSVQRVTAFLNSQLLASRT